MSKDDGIEEFKDKRGRMQWEKRKGMQWDESEIRLMQFGTFYTEMILKSVFQIPPKDAQSASLFYNLYIQLFPTTLLNMGELGSKLFRQRVSYINLKSGIDELLGKGFMSRIISTLDTPISKHESYFRGEAYLPINPKVLKTIIPSMPEFSEAPDKYLDYISNIYEKKFGYDQLKKGLKLPSSVENGYYAIPIYYNTSWIFYNILGNIRDSDSSQLSMICSVRELNENRNLFEKLVDTNLRIKMLVIRNDADENDKFESIIRNLGENIIIRFAPKEFMGTSRLVILKNIFALDGKILLPFIRESSSNLGTIYLDQSSMTVIENIFDTQWTTAEALK